MRTALWPRGASEHPREIEAYLASSVDKSAVFVAENPEGGLSGLLEAGVRDYADGCSTLPVAYIEGWYVDPEARRSGIGSALLDAAEYWGRSLGLAEIASDSEVGNEVGQRAHLARGYQEVGRVVQFRKALKGAV